MTIINNNFNSGRRQAMSVKGLAEGIILQSIEDLWDDNVRAESIDFFAGKEFSICAEIAGMNLSDQLKVLNLVKGVIGDLPKVRTAERDGFRITGKKPERIAKKLHRVMQAVP